MGFFEIEPRRPLLVPTPRGVRIDASATKVGPVGPRGPQGLGSDGAVQVAMSQQAGTAVRVGVNTGTVGLLVIADSKGAGTGLTDYADRWQDRLLALMRARFPVAGGDSMRGLVPANMTDPYDAMSGRPTTTGTTYPVDTAGLGYNTLQLELGSVLTFPAATWPAASTLPIGYHTHSGANGTLEVLVDGVVQTEINCAGTGEGEPIRTSIPIAAGTHTVSMRPKAGTAPVRVMYAEQRSTSTGWHLYDATRPGLAARHVVAGPAGAPQGDESFAAAVTQLPSVRLAVVALGANDMTISTPAQYGSDVRGVVDMVKAGHPTAGVVVVLPAALTDDSAVVDDVQAYHTAARAALVDVPDLSILAETQLVDTTGPNAGAWLADSVHPNELGHDLISRALAGSLIGLDGPTDALSMVEAAVAPAVADAQAAADSSAQSAADTEVAKQAAIDAAALVGAPPSEVVSAVVGRMLVDAKAEGVTGDGTTNDTTALNALIANVSAAGGGVIVLPIGTYLTTAVNGASNVTLRGVSREGVILRKTVSNSTWIKTNAATKFRIENMTIDGAGLVTSYGIEFSSGSTDCAVVGCTLKNFTQAVETRSGTVRPTVADCLITGVGTGVRLNQDPVGAVVRGNVFEQWTESAVYSLGSATQASVDSIIEGNVIHRHTVGSAGIRQAIRFSGDDARHHVRPIIRGNVVTGAYTNHQDTLDPGSADLVSLHRCTGFIVADNRIRGGGDVGITIAQGCRDGKVINNISEDNDTVGLCLGSADSLVAVRDIIVSGNTFKNNAQDRADTGGTPITMAVTRAKAGALIIRAQDCAVVNNSVIYDAGHPTAVRNGLAFRETTRVYYGAPGASNKITGATQSIYTESPVSVGLSTSADVKLNTVTNEIGRIDIGGVPLIVGSVEPEGVFDAPRGAVYFRTAGAAGEQIYYKNGTGTTGWRPSTTAAVQTTANLASVTHAINTTGKFAGRPVYDSTSGKPLWAANGNANGVWRDATGAAVITPA